ncbi:MAG TPA: peptide-methionine (S)-S-oxide reductase MsrA [Devosia sp.]|nr:peptide-methionine (S)-S-oxide reductase MsrA [Devosia sp.]
MSKLKSIARGLALAAILPLAALGLWTTSSQAEGILPVSAPAPVVDEPATDDGTETAVFAGGCFWGVQGVFQHVKGVKSAISGYSGGNVDNPTYEMVGTETTGHAESVKVEFDPRVVTYGKLLQIFFSVITDPTTLNYQGNDYGTSYRSALFVINDAQKKVAEAYIDQLNAAKIYPDKIVTEVTPYKNFFQAEDYHQDNAYTMKVNPGYLAYFDEPKIADMKARFPDYWMDKPVLVFASNA